MKRAFFLLALLSGCATAPEQAPPEAPAPESPPAETVQRQESVAVAGLMQSARSDTAAGRLSNAAASLERALRIEPRNPRLWHELARLRLKQGEYAQAESMAARSNAWAGNDAALRAANQQVIEAAREGAGRR
jgi:tetratricopeptide (TPR) repeat protein